MPSPIGGTPKPAKLTPERKRLYGSLVEAVGNSPGTLADPAQSGRVADDLERRYAQAPLQEQSHVDSALDAVELGLAPGSFTSMSVSGRLAHLRTATAAERGGSGLRPGRTSLVADAIALAAAPFDPRGFTWATSTVELWIRTNALAAAQ